MIISFIVKVKILVDIKYNGHNQRQVHGQEEDKQIESSALGQSQ